MNTQNILPTKEKIKEDFANELNISHLPAGEQDTLMSQLSALLLERITTDLMMRLPKEEFVRINTLLDARQEVALEATLHKYIPNAAAIIEDITIETISEFKALSKLNIIKQEPNTPS